MSQITDSRELSLHGSLTFLGYSADPALDKPEWIADGAALATMDKALRFAIGDWVLFGERHYGEEHAQAIDATALSYSSINSARWVSSRIPEIRRRTNLSWSHHEAVASLEPAKQDELLDRAERERLDRDQTRTLAREAKGLPPAEEMVYVPAERVKKLEHERDEARDELAKALRETFDPGGDGKAVKFVTIPEKRLDDLRELARHANVDAQKEYADKWDDPL